MATDPKARKPHDTVKDLVEIGLELIINQVKLRDSRGERKVKLQLEQAALLYCRLDGCLRELGVSLQPSDSWQRQLRQARDGAHTRGLMLGFGLGAAAASGLGIAWWLLFCVLDL